MPLLLASASPRRRLLLTTAGVPIAEVRAPEVSEEVLQDEDPVSCARRLAREKALAVGAPGHWILAADTIVHLDGRTYPKPSDDDDARVILSRLSGRTHLVTTAWCLRHDGVPPHQVEGATTSAVRFRALTPAEIDGYVASGEGRDKAGAYGIQGLGGALVAEVRGSYPNVVGLPLEEVLAALSTAAVIPPPETR